MTKSPSRLLTPGRALPRGRRVLSFAPLALFLAVVVLALPGCPTGYVQTSTGATVAAPTVYAQDIVGDALNALQGVHNATVQAHDAKAGAEPADVHAKRRAALVASASGLRAAWDGLAAWKLGSEGAGMVATVSKVRDALAEMLRAAVALGVVSPDYADAIGVFFGSAAQGQTPAPLARASVSSSAASRHVFVREPGGRYYDGCNWCWEDGGFGGCTVLYCGGAS